MSKSGSRRKLSNYNKHFDIKTMQIGPGFLRLSRFRRGCFLHHIFHSFSINTLNKTNFVTKTANSCIAVRTLKPKIESTASGRPKIELPYFKVLFCYHLSKFGFRDCYGDLIISLWRPISSAARNRGWERGGS